MGLNESPPPTFRLCHLLCPRVNEIIVGKPECTGASVLQGRRLTDLYAKLKVIQQMKPWKDVLMEKDVHGMLY